MNLKFARNQLLPQVDAVGTYGYNGLSGRTNSAPDLFGGARACRFRARPSLSRHGRRVLRVATAPAPGRPGAILSIPIGNVTARAQRRRAQFDLRRAETHPAPRGAAIVLNIREAIRVQRAAQEGIEAAERSRLAAEEQFRAEQHPPRARRVDALRRAAARGGAGRRREPEDRGPPDLPKRPRRTRPRPGHDPPGPQHRHRTGARRCGKLRGDSDGRGGQRESVRQEPGRPGWPWEEAGCAAGTERLWDVAGCDSAAAPEPLPDYAVAGRQAGAYQRRGGYGQHREVDHDQGRSVRKRRPRGRGQRRRHGSSSPTTSSPLAPTAT